MRPTAKERQTSEGEAVSKLLSWPWETSRWMWSDLLDLSSESGVLFAPQGHLTILSFSILSIYCPAQNSQHSFTMHDAGIWQGLAIDTSNSQTLGGTAKRKITPTLPSVKQQAVPSSSPPGSHIASLCHQLASSAWFVQFSPRNMVRNAVQRMAYTWGC